LGPAYDPRRSRFGCRSRRHPRCSWGFLVLCAPCASSIGTEHPGTDYSSSFGRAGANRHGADGLGLDVGTWLHPFIGNLAKLIGNDIRADIWGRRAVNDVRDANHIRADIWGRRAADHIRADIWSRRAVDDSWAANDICLVLRLPAVPGKDPDDNNDVAVLS
jgi:hypothetical protein